MIVFTNIFDRVFVFVLFYCDAILRESFKVCVEVMFAVTGELAFVPFSFWIRVCRDTRVRVPHGMISCHGSLSIPKS